MAFFIYTNEEGLVRPSFLFHPTKQYSMASILNTENREYITWQYEQLNFGLLGGLKIEGLERMRVTLKVEYKQLAVRTHLQEKVSCKRWK